MSSSSPPRRVAASLTLGIAAVVTLLGGAGCGAKDRFASVNGQVISHDDYMRALERAPITVPTPPGAPPQQVPAGRFVLDQLVGNKVVMAEASRLQVAPTDDEVSKRFDLQKRLMKEQMPDKDFDKEMKSQGRTEQDVKDEIRAQLAETNLLAKRLDLKEEAVKKAYDSQKTVLGFPDRAQLRLIVAQAGSPDFQQVQQMLSSKTDFAEIAKKVNAPALRANGGLLAQALPYKAVGPAQQSLPAPWVAKVKATADGGYFGPVDFPGQPGAKAWVRVERKLAAYQLTYEDAKPLIRQALVRQQMTDPKNRPIRDSIVDLKMKASIETGDDRYKTVWEAVKEQARASGIGADAAPSAGMVPQAPGSAIPAVPPALPAPR